MSSDTMLDFGTVAISKFRKAVSFPLRSDTAVGYALTCLMRAEKDGFACALLLDKKKRYISTVCLKRHGEMAELNLLDLLEDAVDKHGASYFVVAHNHKAGILIPSAADLMTTELIRQRFLNEKAVFLDHYIIAGDTWVTLLNRRSCKKYIKPEELL